MSAILLYPVFRIILIPAMPFVIYALKSCVEEEKEDPNASSG